MDLNLDAIEARLRRYRQQSNLASALPDDYLAPTRTQLVMLFNDVDNLLKRVRELEAAQVWPMRPDGNGHVDRRNPGGQ